MGALKREIDIELLLRWAYREELPKREIGGLTGWERMALLQTPVDESFTPESVFPVALGAPHPDALLIDYAVRSLPAVRVDWKRERKHLMGDLHNYLTDDDPLVAGMSTTPKGGERNLSTLSVPSLDLAKSVKVANGHQDRLVDVHAQARRSNAMHVPEPDCSAAALVILHAQLGARPLWDIGKPELLPVKAKNGKVIVCGVTAGRRYGEGSYCPLELSPPASEIACARWEYSVWHSSLCALARAFREIWMLAGFEVLDPQARSAPWRTGELPPVRAWRRPGRPKPPGKPPVRALPPLPRATNSEVRSIPITALTKRRYDAC